MGMLAYICQLLKMDTLWRLGTINPKNYNLKLMHIIMRCSCLLFVFGWGQGWCTQRGFVKTRLKRDLNIDFRVTTERRWWWWCNLQLLKRANVFPEWSCGSCFVPEVTDNARVMMMMMSRDGGGGQRRAALQSHPDSLSGWTTFLGEGIEWRKENSARKKLKTKRKESRGEVLRDSWNTCSVMDFILSV